MKQGYEPEASLTALKDHLKKKKIPKIPNQQNKIKTRTTHILHFSSGISLEKDILFSLETTLMVEVLYDDHVQALRLFFE